MKVHAYFFTLLAAASSVLAMPAPVPHDPLNLDPCGLVGADSGRTPQTLKGSFKLMAQKHDFTGPSFFVGETQTSLSSFSLVNSDEAATFSFQDGILHNSEGVPAVFVLQYTGKLARGFVGFSRESKFTKLPFVAQHVCDPVTKEAVLELSYEPTKNTST